LAPRRQLAVADVVELLEKTPLREKLQRILLRGRRLGQIALERLDAPAGRPPRPRVTALAFQLFQTLLRVRQRFPPPVPLPLALERREVVAQNIADFFVAVFAR